jgi:hypothetical protein
MNGASVVGSPGCWRFFTIEPKPKEYLLIGVEKTESPILKKRRPGGKSGSAWQTLEPPA